MASEAIFRLSDLPYDILELIINLLSPKDVVRLSTLSKEWMNRLCPSLPCLKLDLHDHDLEKLQSDDHTELNEYVDTLLAPYKTSGLCIFNLISHEQHDKFQNFTQLLVSEAIKCFSPRVINIDMFISNFASIHKIFTCQSVEELYLRDTSNKRTNKLNDLVIPCRMGVTLFSLRRLHIEFVRFYDEIISGCPAMEELSLKSCLVITVRSIISSTKLKFLSLDDCTFKCINSSQTLDHDHMPMSPLLLFDAPNLETLKVSSSSSGKRKTLVNTLKIVNNSLNACSSIEHLELCGRELKVLLDEELPRIPRLHNLKTLSLNGWCMDCHVGPLVQFLEHAPYLEKLTLWVNECYCLALANRKNNYSKRLDRVANNLANLTQIDKAPCNMLKNVEIIVSVGYNKKAHKSVMSFLRYAKVLEHTEIKFHIQRNPDIY